MILAYFGHPRIAIARMMFRNEGPRIGRDRQCEDQLGDGQEDVDDPHQVTRPPPAEEPARLPIATPATNVDADDDEGEAKRCARSPHDPVQDVTALWASCREDDPGSPAGR